MQHSSYKRIIALVITIVGLGLALMPAAASADAVPACPYNGDDFTPALSLSGPKNLAFSRLGIIDISNQTGNDISSASIVMTKVATGVPFYSYTFTQKNLNDLNGDNDQFAGITIMPSSSTAQVTLFWTEEDDFDDFPTCSGSRTITVSPITGVAPSVREQSTDDNDGNGDSLVIGAPGGCNNTKANVPVSVTVHGGKTNAIWRTKDACVSGSWHHTGTNVPGASIWTKVGGNGVNWGGSELIFEPGGNTTKDYTITVKIGKQKKWTRNLHTFYEFDPAERVWQYTDDYVNYCINGGHQIYSSNLILYCWRPSVTYHWVTIDNYRY